MKIDIHTHIMPETLPKWAERFGYGGFVSLEHHCAGCARMMIDDKFFREIQANCWDPQTRLTECAAHKVDVQVLSAIPVLFSYWARPQDGLDVARFLNDHIAEIVAAYPKKFIGLGTLPMQAPDLAVIELERCVKDLGMAGVQIGSHINDWNLNEAALFPVFEAAARLGAAVFVHPWEMMGKERTTRYWTPWLVGMPAETSLAICAMIFGGVFERLPDLRVAFAHGGGSFPATFGRIKHGFEVRPDLCAVDNPHSPEKYIGQFYFDSLVHDPRMLRFLLEFVGENRIALGTDYPFPLGELEPGKLIETLPDLSSETRERLLSGTALEWLGIPRERFLSN